MKAVWARAVAGLGALAGGAIVAVYVGGCLGFGNGALLMVLVCAPLTALSIISFFLPGAVQSLRRRPLAHRWQRDIAFFFPVVVVLLWAGTVVWQSGSSNEFPTDLVTPFFACYLIQVSATLACLHVVAYWSNRW